MRLALVLLLLARAAQADVTRLGDFALGQEIKKSPTARAKLFGCSGELRATLDRKKKVTRVRYEAAGCTLASAAAAISKEVGVAMIANAAGDKLWEGKTAAILMTSRGGNAPLILLVAPSGGAKRVCFPADGFATFWATFKTAVASGKPIEPSFAFKLDEPIDPADLKAIASGSATAECKVQDEAYVLRLDSSGIALEATRVRGVWKWTRRSETSPD